MGQRVEATNSAALLSSNNSSTSRSHRTATPARFLDAIDSAIAYQSLPRHSPTAENKHSSAMSDGFPEIPLTDIEDAMQSVRERAPELARFLEANVEVGEEPKRI